MWSIINKIEWDKMQAMFPKQSWPDSNMAPANFREVTEAEFCHSHYYTGYSYAAIGYFQFTRSNEGKDFGKRVHGQIFINSFGKGWLPEIRHWENKVVYWIFDLCLHEYETTEKRKCWWAGKCKKCGHLHGIDSSD